MTTLADCRKGTCPCSRPEYPGDDHRCPSDGLGYAEREEARERELNRPFEVDEGIPLHLGWL